MSTSLKSAINRRVTQQQQQQQQIPQNRLIPGTNQGMQSVPSNFDNRQQGVSFGQPIEQQQQQQRVGSNMTLQQSFDLVFNRLSSYGGFLWR